MAYPFIGARNYTPTSGRKVNTVVIHTMEYPERPTGAEWCADYFAKLGAPKASAHYLADNNSIVQGVREQDVAWAAPGANHDGIQIEHTGYAMQTPTDWQDEFSQAMLKLSAELVAGICKRHNIPVVWLSPADLLAGKRGITSHAAVSVAFKRSNHWDPGKGFPVAQYLSLIKAAMGTKPVPVTPEPDKLTGEAAKAAFVKWHCDGRKDARPNIVQKIPADWWEAAKAEQLKRAEKLHAPYEVRDAAGKLIYASGLPAVAKRLPDLLASRDQITIIKR